MNPAATWEYMQVVYPRHRQASSAGKDLILDEFCKVYRSRRKHASRMLHGPILSAQ